MPFNLKASQKKWIEVFQLSEPSNWEAHLFLPSSRIDFIAVPGMILSCGVYGAGGPIHFSINYNEAGQAAEITLTGTDGSKSEIKVAAN
jgi:hypothetical protein